MRKDRASIFNFVTTLLVVVIFLTPMLNRNLPRPVQISLVGFYFVTLFFERKSGAWLRRNTDLLLWILIWQALEILYWVSGYSTAASGNYLMGLFSYAVIIVGLYSSYSFNKFQKISLILVIIGAIIYNMYDNIMLNALYGGATNDIYKDWGSDYLSMNVAETGFYGAVMLLIGCLNIVLFNSDNGRITKILVVSVIVLSVGFDFFITPRAIACALIILEVALILIKSHFITTKNLLLVVIVTMAAFFVLRNSLVLVEDDTHGGAGRLLERVDSILAFINREGVDSDSSFGARINLYWMTIETWLSTPVSFLVGIGYHLGDYGFSRGLGQHSRYADVLANYGIIGFSILSVLTYTLYKKIRKIAQSKWYLYRIIFVMYILYGIVDHNRNVQMIIILFVFLPNIDIMISSHKQIQ